MKIPELVGKFNRKDPKIQFGPCLGYGGAAGGGGAEGGGRPAELSSFSADEEEGWSST